MRLYVVAYPQICNEDFNLIQNCRRENDRLFKLIDPHFTLVFAVEDFSIPDFRDEIKRQLKGIKTIQFSLRCAVINKDSFSENYFAFLVPDEGFSGIIKLHDRLYSDKLTYHRRLDIDYIPHIEIANSPDKKIIKKMADEWNEKDFQIDGVIESVEVIRFDNGVLTVIEQMPLL